MAILSIPNRWVIRFGLFQGSCLFVYHKRDVLWITRLIFLEKHRGRLPHWYTWSTLLLHNGIGVAHSLLLFCTGYFGISFYLMCVFVFSVWECILLIVALIVVSFFTKTIICNCNYPDRNYSKRSYFLHFLSFLSF